MSYEYLDSRPQNPTEFTLDSKQGHVSVEPNLFPGRRKLAVISAVVFTMLAGGAAPAIVNYVKNLRDDRASHSPATGIGNVDLAPSTSPTIINTPRPTHSPIPRSSGGHPT